MGTGSRILSPMSRPDQAIHPTAIVDGPNTHVGAETKIWHYAHVMAGTWIGDRCSIGQGCFIGKVRIGHGCRIQNNVSIYEGVTLEDDVFIAPGVMVANDPCPVCTLCMKGPVLRRGVKVGVNVTLLPHIDVGAGSLIAAGAVVTRDVPPGSVVVGNPGRVVKNVRDVECFVNVKPKAYPDAP